MNPERLVGACRLGIRRLSIMSADSKIENKIENKIEKYRAQKYRPGKSWGHHDLSINSSVAPIAKKSVLPATLTVAGKWRES
jgi:hypothetical protein